MYARLRCGGNLPLCLAFGTGVLGVLWWLGGWVVGIRYRRGPPMVRKRYSVPKTAFSGTRRIFKPRRTAPATSNASPKARRTADSTDCGQPPGVRDAFSGAPGA